MSEEFQDFYETPCFMCKNVHKNIYGPSNAKCEACKRTFHFQCSKNINSSGIVFSSDFEIKKNVLPDFDGSAFCNSCAMYRCYDCNRNKNDFWICVSCFSRNHYNCHAPLEITEFSHAQRCSDIHVCSIDCKESFHFENQKNNPQTTKISHQQILRDLDEIF